MIAIPTAAKTTIDRIVKDQEGGWKLTSNANDPDGGWTYAGVTHTTFQKYFRGYDISMVQGDNIEADEDVYYIYWQEYCQPISFDKLPVDLQGPLLSAAINIGVEDAVKILQTAFFIPSACDGVLGSKTLAALEKRDAVSVHECFLREWTRHYIQLVAGNAQAWHSYALYGSDPKSGVSKPAVFRAGDLEGWFNRVEYWRT